MQSLRYLYRIGRGPSSSHTMGPFAAAKQFLAENPNGKEYKAILYGSLAKTGKGHMTDSVLYEVFSKKRFSVEFDGETVPDYHPNMMDLMVLDDKGGVAVKKRYYSIGGGEIIARGETKREHREIYNFNSFFQISEYCRKKNIRIWQYVEGCEGKEIWEYLKIVWKVMQKAIERGLQTEGILHGGIRT
ncbi:MAG: serine dehydratase, partial [Clostridia bacterium]|nr:serine dehydratase [Clostridia bacterium]